MIVINLDFDRYDKTLISLSGRRLGERTFNDQIESKLNEQDKIILNFPDKIEVVASSFVQGLLSKELEKIGLNAVKSKFDVKSNVPGFEKNFWGSLD